MSIVSVKDLTKGMLEMELLSAENVITMLSQQMEDVDLIVTEASLHLDEAQAVGQLRVAALLRSHIIYMRSQREMFSLMHDTWLERSRELAEALGATDWQ